MTADGSTIFFPWEVRFMEWFQTVLGQTSISVLSFFSVFGEQTVMILILGFVYWSYNKKLGKTVGLGVLAASLWCTSLKNIVLRRRPYFDNEGIKLYRAVEPDADIYDIAAQGYSFPSIHSANAAAAYGGLAANSERNKRLLFPLAAALPLLTGISRVAVGVHYPTDVLAGWLLGSIALIAIPVIEKRSGVSYGSLPVYIFLLITGAPGLLYCRSEDYFTTFGLTVGFIGGMIIEERFCSFENTRNPVRMALRPIGGMMIYFALNTFLKLPFSDTFLSGGSYAALLVRAARYAVIALAEFGFYPMLFRYGDRFEMSGKRKTETEA